MSSLYVVSLGNLRLSRSSFNSFTSASSLVAGLSNTNWNINFENFLCCVAEMLIVNQTLHEEMFILGCGSESTLMEAPCSGKASKADFAVSSSWEKNV
ncbi:hypothetical protein MUK42_32773 [Musa troglodytarum]|uniref:Uncharacterized protein n=1 Tax=Musa troglodytarum TaxID=320322 RepID=A0A9E7G1N4_9LILI|nr:hypothetical protein MUK42_32773 [Musa troglodytarum]URE05966.1 hypothetical protein MUK42_32773 [Musa troglodytarum]URE05967.1 hypothetical protein MUK42_32773 [Musa troglodytarum]URE05970.1 hypothetical protein MUK42_32773 [Musa troglodytarum]